MLIYVVLLCGIYLGILSIMMKTDNVISFALFNAIPFLLSIFTIIYSLDKLNII